MKGVLIRPLRLIRRAVVIAALAAAVAAAGGVGALRERAGEALAAAGEWIGCAMDAAEEALPKVRDAVNERVVPAFAEAVEYVRERFAPDDGDSEPERAP